MISRGCNALDVKRPGSPGPFYCQLIGACGLSERTLIERASNGDFLYRWRMSEARRFVNIALVGFMGTGKSTVGQLVAGMLSFRFLDTDSMIEGMARRKIAEIFATDGEARFREYEREVVAQLASAEGLVIATGGGLIANPENLANLRSHSLIACLWATPETILKRVGHQTHRPLLRVENPLERIRSLLQERAPFYRQADVLLSSDFRKPKEVASHLVHEYRAVLQRAVAR